MKLFRRRTLERKSVALSELPFGYATPDLMDDLLEGFGKLDGTEHGETLR
jgi:hypothetical protein